MSEILIIGKVSPQAELTTPPHSKVLHVIPPDSPKEHIRPDLIVVGRGIGKEYIDKHVNTKASICPIVYT